jgi:predicted PurR-regulated permease PerM
VERLTFDKLIWHPVRLGPSLSNCDCGDMTAPLAASATSRLKWRRALEGHEALAMLGQWIDQLNLPGAIGNVASWLATSSASLLRGWILELLTVLLTFYLLFYFLRDRSAASCVTEARPLIGCEGSRP